MAINIENLSEAELIELNHKIVHRLRLMQQVYAHKEMIKFKIGDKVTFSPAGKTIQTGTLTRFNKKTVTVITEDGGHWNVAPQCIQLAEIKVAQKQPSKKLELISDENIQKHQYISRNAPCPCGSGKKYKRCCESKH